MYDVVIWPGDCWPRRRPSVWGHPSDTQLWTRQPWFPRRNPFSESGSGGREARERKSYQAGLCTAVTGTEQSGARDNILCTSEWAVLFFCLVTLYISPISKRNNFALAYRWAVPGGRLVAALTTGKMTFYFKLSFASVDVNKCLQKYQRCSDINSGSHRLASTAAIITFLKWRKKQM